MGKYLQKGCLVFVASVFWVSLASGCGDDSASADPQDTSELGLSSDLSDASADSNSGDSSNGASENSSGNTSNNTSAGNGTSAGNSSGNASSGASEGASGDASSNTSGNSSGNGDNAQSGTSAMSTSATSTSATSGNSAGNGNSAGSTSATSTSATSTSSGNTSAGANSSSSATSASSGSATSANGGGFGGSGVYNTFGTEFTLDPSKMQGCIMITDDYWNRTLVGFEDPVCVVDQLISALVDTLVSRGDSPEVAKEKATEKLYSTFITDPSEIPEGSYNAAYIGTALIELVPRDTLGYTYRSDFIKALAQDKPIDKAMRCVSFTDLPSIYASFLHGHPISLGAPYPTGAMVKRQTFYYCGEVPACDDAHQDVIITYMCKPDIPPCLSDGNRLLCQNGTWAPPTRLYYETHNHACTVNNTRIPSDSVPGAFYVCHEGKWYTSETNKLDTLPQEYFFNPNLSYGTMTDPRDGKQYKTTTYKNQVWMAQNIDYYSETDTHLKDGAKCAPFIECDYGRFYKRSAAKYACPTGWRLPTQSDVSHLVDMTYTDANNYMPKLFSQLSGIRKASDDFGMSILKMYGIDSYGTSTTMSGYGLFWLDSGLLLLLNTNARIQTTDYGEYFPVRCIKE
jgi:uncharacterized protein (TIGR02145 family)